MTDEQLAATIADEFKRKRLRTPLSLRNTETRY
jgi:hypothetical protein